MIYSQLYSWQFTPLTITLLAIAALAAIVLLVTIIPALNLIIHKSDEDNVCTELDEKEGISVIVSTGFHTDLLKEFIENLYAQNFSAPIEVIIVNTGGEEYTEDTIRMLQADYPDIKNTFVPSQSRNLSRRKLAITLGIKAASHPVILLTSANAVPSGSDWLASIMHHFREGADIVIASTVMQNRKNGETVGAIRSFDSMKSALRRVPEAMKGKPVGADSSNLAYRKSLFFDNKGFCETLNLNYGDDDIFISEIAKDRTVAVDLAPDSILSLHEDNPRQIYDLERISRAITQSRLRRAPFILSGIQDMMWWVWLIATVAAIITGLPSLMPVVCSLVIGILLILPMSLKWKKAARALALTPNTLLMPVMALIYPFTTLRYKISLGKKIRNYTWQN